MRITIETKDTDAAVAPPSTVTSAQQMPIVDAGMGAASAQVRSSDSADAAAGTDAGAPPAWLLAAVGATRAASEAAASRASGAAPDQPDGSFTDAGTGPTSASR